MGSRKELLLIQKNDIFANTTVEYYFRIPKIDQNTIQNLICQIIIDKIEIAPSEFKNINITFGGDTLLQLGHKLLASAYIQNSKGSYFIKALKVIPPKACTFIPKAPEIFFTHENPEIRQIFQQIVTLN